MVGGFEIEVLGYRSFNNQAASSGAVSAMRLSCLACRSAIIQKSRLASSRFRCMLGLFFFLNTKLPYVLLACSRSVFEV